MAFYEQIVEYFAATTRLIEPDFTKREKAAQSLRTTYAELKSSSRARRLSAEQRAVYGVTRLAGTLAVMREVLALLVTRHQFLPQTVLDCGFGPGTALFAAYEFFGAHTRFVGIEKDAGFVTTAENAIKALMPEAINQFHLINGVAPNVVLNEKADLTLLSYVVSETAPDALHNLIDFALTHTSQYVVITDAGTPQVYRQMMDARQRLIEKGWSIVAPCPHKLACPMQAPDFCHFPARFTRHADARQLKSASAQAEDEKYCYLIACAKDTVSPPISSASRVIKRPIRRSGHCILDLCTNAGVLERRVVSKKHKDAWHATKKISWGDEWAAN